MKIAEAVPAKKIAWDVIDTYQAWVKEPTEWIGTKIIWEVKEVNSGSETTLLTGAWSPNLCVMTTANQDGIT